ncbi:carbohydrate ABC transporter permease [Burkholderia pseudomallei]|uniref:Ribose ABC transporter, permease protein n=7 Tax=Burkholderia pseudomallei TaxID=28450 RepID=Q3JSI7_BURP1|nr:ribose ABC transporter, permease protein [Burkholderia pseudomallei 1710b]AFI66372.1 ribose ABC transporter, permease protein [Burkholderia pseudomallei 1026b]AGR71420.1 branched-chain amino acid transport system / permease component family protein [Burkholderia pseudomallei MSHR305]AGZ27867.1 branched-chain amino acid transport system / permease component family protein [Burkholderia pseudomallei NCTC 13179]AHK67198.1 branched-chain amino acid transport system / permease component family pr
MNMHDRTAAPSASCAPAAASPARATGPARAAHALAALRRSTTFYPLVGLVAVCVAMVFASDSFLSAANLENVLRQVSINAIIGVGMTCVILTGGIDLSVGSVMALSGTLAAGLLVAGANGAAALAAGIGVGVALGAANGLFVAFAGMPPIIVTLATMGIARGLALIYTGGYPIDGLPDWVRFFGSGKVLGVQMPVLTMLAVYALAWLMLERMPFGRYVYAIGGNEHATRLSGVRVSRVKLAVYTFAGLTSALAALVLTGRLMSGQPNAGGGFELDAIAAVVMGGTSIAGGRGSIVGTLVGALLLGVLNNGLNMIGVNPYVQNVIKGAIILLAIYIGRERRT